MPTIEFSIQQGDITSFDADVLALKYAQEFFGTDEIIAHLLSKVGIPLENLRPDVGNYRYVETQNCIKAHHALFIGVPKSSGFTYSDIQEFAIRVLAVLAHVAPTTRHLAMTIHGAGFGLDEIQALFAQFQGYLQALQSGLFPTNLEKITIIDRDLERVHHLREALYANYSHAHFVSIVGDRGTYLLDKPLVEENPNIEEVKERRSKPYNEKRSRVFISYSHKDERLLEELKTHLTYFEKVEPVEIWDDKKITPGGNWREEIRKALEATKVAVLLVSPDFLASKFIAENELPPLLTAAKDKGAIILSVILRPCLFEFSPLQQYQTVNPPSKPLSDMKRAGRDVIWVKIAKLIRENLPPTSKS